MAAARLGVDGPIDFNAWIEEVKPELQPPVGNKLLYGNGQHKVMIVGGPNIRKDYHLEEGEEIFLQLAGSMTVETFEKGKPKSVVIQEGEIFLLPGRIPHSPQRLAGTIGLVIERERLKSESDSLRWYTPSGTGRVLYQEFFYCHDLGVQLKPCIQRFLDSDASKTGVPSEDYEHADAPVTPDGERTLHEPFNLRKWIDDVAKPNHANCTTLFGKGAVDASLSDFEYLVEVVTGPVAAWSDWQAVGPGELFVYQLEGDSMITLKHNDTGAEASFEMHSGFVFLIPAGQFLCKATWGVGAAMLVRNSVTIS